jgi:hypothetical protein
MLPSARELSLGWFTHMILGGGSANDAKTRGLTPDAMVVIGPPLEGMVITSDLVIQ